MILFILYILALLDGALCGFRAAAGRCPLIHIRQFYFRSMVRGFIVTQAASAFALAALVCVAWSSHNRTLLMADLERSGVRMVTVFAAYAGLVLVNLALRLTPSVDVRCATSVFVLGPLTALRPVAMVAGTLYGIWPSPLLATRLLGAFVLVLMLASELALNRMNDRLQERELQALVLSAPSNQSAASEM